MARRAANGESSIHQGADGRWHGYVTVGLLPGARADRRHVSAATRAGTVGKVRDLERKRDAGLTATAGPAPTLGEWLEHWLTNIAAHRMRRRSLESYRATVRLHLSPGIGRHRLDRLQPEHLEQLYSVLLAEGLAPATVLRAHRILSRALKVAMQRGRIARNVATLVDPPAARHTDTAQPLSLDEARQVLETAVIQRNAARWTVALALGLRQSEALALRWGDIDWTLGTLTVRRGVHRVAGGGLSTRNPSPNAAAAPSPSPRRSSRPFASSAVTSTPSARSPATCGRNTGSSSPRPTAVPSTRRSTTTTGPSCSHPPECATSACTTDGTPPRPCC